MSDLTVTYEFETTGEYVDFLTVLAGTTYVVVTEDSHQKKVTFIVPVPE